MSQGDGREERVGATERCICGHGQICHIKRTRLGIGCGLCDCQRYCTPEQAEEMIARVPRTLKEAFERLEEASRRAAFNMLDMARAFGAEPDVPVSWEVEREDFLRRLEAEDDTQE